MTDHYVLEESHPKWLPTVLTSIAGVLISALLLWIASTQLTLVTATAVIKRDLQAQGEALEKNSTTMGAAIDRILPRLQVHGQNIEVLRQRLEVLCDCTVNLKSQNER